VKITVDQKDLLKSLQGIAAVVPPRRHSDSFDVSPRNKGRQGDVHCERPDVLSANTRVKHRARKHRDTGKV
jgi:hypothetical protein